MNDDKLRKVISGSQTVTYPFLMSLSEEEVTRCKQLLSEYPNAYFVHMAFDWLDRCHKTSFNKMGLKFISRGDDPCFFPDNIPFIIALGCTALLLMILTIFNPSTLMSAISMVCAISCILGIAYTVYDCERLEWKTHCTYNNFFKCRVIFTQDSICVPKAKVYIPYSSITDVKTYNKDLCVTCDSTFHLITFNVTPSELPIIVAHIKSRMEG